MLEAAVTAKVTRSPVLAVLLLFRLEVMVGAVGSAGTSTVIAQTLEVAVAVLPFKVLVTITL